MSGMKKLELIDKTNLNSNNLKFSQAHVEIICNIGLQISQTQIVLYVNNEGTNESEAELIFQLDDGEVISGYEIDVDGRMVPAVVVPKEKARTVFEAEVRSHSNAPSIVENVAGNVFKIRIYPIRPRFHRIVKVTYIGPFQQNCYSLQLSSSQHLLTSLSCKMDVVCPLGFAKELPSLVQSSFGPSFQLRKVDDDIAVHYSSSIRKEVTDLWNQNDQPTFLDLVCTLPSLVNSVSVVEEDSGLKYFCINDIGLPEQLTYNPSTPDIKLIGIFWDSSLSRASSDVEKQLTLLATILNALKNVTVHVFVFSNDIHSTSQLVGKVSRFDQLKMTVQNGNTKQVTDFLRKVEYSGATDLSCLQFLKKSETANMDYGYHLLFTDGISTVGSDTPGVSEAPVYIFSVEQQVNRNALRTIALRSGGEFFSIRELTGTQSQDIVSRIHNTPFSFISSTYDKSLLYDGTILIDIPHCVVYPSSPVKLQSNKFFLCGKIRRKVSHPVQIQLHYGYGSRITKSKIFVLAPNSSSGKEEEEEVSSLLPRFCAQKKIDELMTLPESHQITQQIEKIGKMYNIVTSTTSFIVLETLEQFLKYSIEPPPSLPSIRREYLQRIQAKNLEERSKVADKIAAVFDLWERRVQWWDTTYDGENWQPNFLHFKNSRKETEFERSIEKIFRQPVWEKEQKEVLDEKKEVELEKTRRELLKQEREILIQTLRSNISAFPNQYDATVTVVNDCVVFHVVLAPTASDDFPQIIKNFLVDLVPTKYHNFIQEMSTTEISQQTEKQQITSPEAFAEFGIKNAEILFHKMKPSPQLPKPTSKKTSAMDHSIPKELSEEEKIQMWLEETRQEIAKATEMLGLEHFQEMSQESSQEVEEIHREIAWIREILKSSGKSDAAFDSLERVLTFVDNTVPEYSENTSWTSSLANLSKNIREGLETFLKSQDSRESSLRIAQQIASIFPHLRKVVQEQKLKHVATDIQACVSTLMRNARAGTTTTAPVTKPFANRTEQITSEGLEVTWFPVAQTKKGQKAPSLILGISRNSIIFMDASTREIKKQYPLKRYAASPTSFTLDLGDHEDDYVVLETKEAEKMASLVTGYIDMILKTRKASAKVMDEQSEIAHEEILQEVKLTPLLKIQRMEEPILLELKPLLMVEKMAYEVVAQKIAMEPVEIISKSSFSQREIRQLSPTLSTTGTAAKPIQIPRLEELDGETRSTVDKMLYDSRSKTVISSTTDLLQTFIQQHPEMDFQIPVSAPATATKALDRKPSISAPTGTTSASLSRKDLAPKEPPQARTPVPPSSFKAKGEDGKEFEERLKERDKKKTESKQAKCDESGEVSIREYVPRKQEDLRSEVTNEEKSLFSGGEEKQIRRSRRNHKQPPATGGKMMDGVPQDIPQVQSQVLADKVDSKDIDDRESALREIEKNMVEVNEIFRDLSALTAEQSELIDHIESNIETSSSSIFDDEDEDQDSFYAPQPKKTWSAEPRKQMNRKKPLISGLSFSQSMKSLSSLESNIASASRSVTKGVTELRRASSYQRKSRRKLVFLLVPVPFMVCAWIFGVWMVLKILFMLGICVAVTIKALLWQQSGIRTGEAVDYSYEWCSECRTFFSHTPECSNLKKLTTESVGRVSIQNISQRSTTAEVAGNSLEYYWKKKKATENSVLIEEEEDDTESTLNKVVPVEVGFFSDKIDSLLQDQQFTVQLHKQTFSSPSMQPDSKLDIPSLIAKSDSIVSTSTSQAEKMLAWKVLSNLAEMELEDQQLYRLLGYKLEEYGLLEPASAVFEKLLKMRGEEPQSYRDLAFANMRLGKFQEAISTLSKVVEGFWDVRFEEIELVVLMDLFGIINLMRLQGQEPQLPDHIRSKLERSMDVDLRIVLTWDLDMTNMELIGVLSEENFLIIVVKEPSPGEVCNSFHNHTKMGGIVSRDFTQGYGPQEYLLKKGGKGTFEIFVELFSTTNPVVLERGVTACVKIYTNWGRKFQKEFVTTSTIHETRKKLLVASITRS